MAPTWDFAEETAALVAEGVLLLVLVGVIVLVDEVELVDDTAGLVIEAATRFADGELVAKAPWPDKIIVGVG